MPHFIAEYTDNIEAEADLPGLFEKVHACLGASGVFPLGGIRSRGVRLDTWRMADGKHDYAFAQLLFELVSQISKPVHVNAVNLRCEKLHAFHFFHLIHHIARRFLSHFAL